MKSILSIALLLILAGNLYGYSDDYRKKEVDKTNATVGYPLTLPSGVYIHGYSYSAKLDAIVLVCEGKPNFLECPKAMRGQWRGEFGRALRKLGFKDYAIVWLQDLSGDGLLFSCRLDKWLKSEDYLKQTS